MRIGNMVIFAGDNSFLNSSMDNLGRAIEKDCVSRVSVGSRNELIIPDGLYEGIMFAYRNTFGAFHQQQHIEDSMRRIYNLFFLNMSACRDHCSSIIRGQLMKSFSSKDVWSNSDFRSMLNLNDYCCRVILGRHSDSEIEKIIAVAKRYVLPKNHQSEEAFSGLLSETRMNMGDLGWFSSLESSLKCTVPMVELEKVVREEKLSSREDAAISGFVDAINIDGNITDACIFNLVNSIFYHRYEKEGVTDSDIIRVLVVLRKRGCRALTLRQQKYYDWVTSLKKGSILPLLQEDLPVKDGKYTVKDEIGATFVETGYRDFLAEEDDSIFLRVYVETFLEVYIRADPDIPPFEKSLLPTFLFIDLNVAMYRRLGASLSNNTWETTSTDLSEQDHRHMLAMSNLVQTCIKENKMPRDIIRYGFFDASGESIKFEILRMQDFNFVEMEGVLQQFSKGNRFVLANLMRATRLYDYPTPEKSVKRLYETAFRETIHDRAFNPAVKVPIMLGMDDQGIKENLITFIATVKNFRDRIIETIRVTYEFEDVFTANDLQRDVWRFLIARYLEMGSVSYVSKELSESVFSNIVKSEHLSVRKSQAVEKLQEVLITLARENISSLDDLSKRLVPDLFHDIHVYNEPQIRTKFIPRIYKAFETLFDDESL